MHFVIAWQVDDVSDERREEIRQTLEVELAPHDHVRVLDNVYSVKVMGNGVMEVIQVRLLEQARAHPERVQVMITPLMTLGVYSGRLGADAVEGLERIAN